MYEIIGLLLSRSAPTCHSSPACLPASPSQCPVLKMTVLMLPRTRWPQALLTAATCDVASGYSSPSCPAQWSQPVCHIEATYMLILISQYTSGSHVSCPLKSLIPPSLHLILFVHLSPSMGPFIKLCQIIRLLRLFDRTNL